MSLLKKVTEHLPQKDKFENKNYKANKLMVAKLIKVHDNKFCPVKINTEQKYIFEIIKENEDVKYREIFSGYICDDIDYAENNIVYDKPYVYEPEAFTNYFPNAKGLLVDKLSLFWLQDDINKLNVENKDKNKQAIK